MELLRQFLVICFVVLLAFSIVVGQECSAITDCDGCTDRNSCVWCADDDQQTGNGGECVDGGFFGPSGWFTFCWQWYYGQCFFNGRWMYYFVFILIIIGLCCCFGSALWFLFCGPNVRDRITNPLDVVYTKWDDYKRSQEMEDMTKAEQRRESMRSKYDLNS